MSILLQLSPDTEARLIAQAKQQGISVDRYLESIIERHLATEAEPEWKTLLDQLVRSPSLTRQSPESETSEDWATVLEEFCNNPALANVPPLSDEAISRESIYREREDSQL